QGPTKMIEGSCHCGAVTISVPRKPETLTSCNCSICRRLGTHMAYFNPAEVKITGQTATYVWGDKCIAFHRCRECGCATHWSSLDPSKTDRMGVNMRLMDPEAMADVHSSLRWREDLEVSRLRTLPRRKS